MRTSNSIKNSITAFLGNGFSFIFAFISQAIFIKQLGAEYLGLNGLFTNILTMLSIFELGIGSAIVYNMYKPIAENDEKRLSALMNFYRKAYNIIALLILLFGMIILPFIKIFIKEVSVDINIYVVYFLFLISTLTSYIMAYKRNLIIANQKNYIINIIHFFYLILLNVIQIIIIIKSKNYYLYLICKIVFQFLENLVISFVADKKYSFILKNKDIKLNKEIEKDIFSRVKALFFHKIGAIIVLGTDNIIISYFLGIKMVGLYTNYNTIITGVTTLFGQIILSTTASVGNLLVDNDYEKRFKTFDNLRFLNFWVSTFTATCILVMMNPFIKIWVGEEYLLSNFVLIILVVNYFQKLQRQTYSTFKDSAGIWREDKYVPLIESILNITFSILFLHIFGLAGVFMGTIISGFALWFYSYPKFVYKKILKRNYFNYIKETISYIFMFFIIAGITYHISAFFLTDSSFIKLVMNLIICLIIPNTLIVIFYNKTDKFKYFVNLIMKGIKKTKNEK